MAGEPEVRNKVGNKTLLKNGKGLLLDEHWVLYGSAGIIIFPTLAYLGVIAPFLNSVAWGVISSLIIIAWACGSLYYLRKVALMDPGIIPPDMSAEEPQESEKEKIIRIEGEEFVLKWCSTCHISRPLRSFHCKICGTCVSVHDHHCPWVANCVGERNHKSFVQFLAVGFTTTFLDFLFCGIRLWELYDADELSSNGIVIVLAVYAMIIGSGLGFLLIYQIKIVSQGITTNEDIRKFYRRKKNPFNKGCIENWKRFWNREIPESCIKGTFFQANQNRSVQYQEA
eukprot:CAMPEP_0115001042 /NCGR_PEP_ID=MMETSP0216-20121206/17129_1 /TAXON_ID=223996 /ORGANISM="Protocruzia adherens, Strain Boccale" /LENGTH=283 /DNA_ID=CAMNT_0002366279 /DNA_START=36 /DNA_END=887 /DNA_ORIENTATION=-